jgi:8-oxo-dGTP diphosphatase
MREVTAAIILDGDKVLMTRRGPGEKLAGCWEFPGGKIRDGESPQECLRRELQEELGLTTAVHEVVAVSEHEYGHGSFRIIALSTQVLDGTIELTVHDRAEWVPINELQARQLAPADIPIAAKLIEGRR